MSVEKILGGKIMARVTPRTKRHPSYRRYRELAREEMEAKIFGRERARRKRQHRDECRRADEYYNNPRRTMDKL